MAMMNYQMPPTYPHTMQNFMDYPIHNPHIHNPHIQNPHIQNPNIHNPNIHNPHMHNPPVENQHIQESHIQASHIQNMNMANPHIHYAQADYYSIESDDESNFTSEDYEDDRMSDDLLDREPSPVDQLLDFAQMVNQDIQKFFGKRKVLDEPEVIADCKKKVRLSGRELYYADLLRVAQHGDSADSCQEVAEPTRVIRFGSSEESNDAESISPKVIESGGLGPLEELFDFAERDFSFNNHQGYECSSQNGGGTWMSAATENSNFGAKQSLLPWRKRALPKSFFTEPSLSVCSTNIDNRLSGTLGMTVAPQSSGHVANSNQHETPDFSDLMANLDAEDDHVLPRVTPVHG